MSVIKRKRKLAKTQFLTNIIKLKGEVRTWCKSQSPRYDSYGLADLYGFAEKAFNEAYMANERFPKTPQDAKYRRAHFKKAIDYLHAFNAKLTSLSTDFDISNTKLKNWSKYSYQAITQMDSVIASDARRVQQVTQ